MPDSDSSEEIESIGPLGAAAVALLLAGYLVFVNPLSSSQAYIRWGLVLIAVLFAGVVVLRAYAKYQEEGLEEATNYLLTPEESEGGETNSTETDKVPPPSQKLKTELYMNRAEKQCEWCGEAIDYHEVHHIEPRAEGGSNDKDNLIVLCSECHTKADRGLINRSKLRMAIEASDASTG